MQQRNHHHYSKIQRLAHLLLALCIAGLPLAGHAAVDNDLPDFGSAANSMLSPAEERRMGKTFMRYIRYTESVVDDPLMDDYINQLGQKLVNNSDGKGDHFRFFLIDDPSINAFAGPYGYIGVNTGLITTTDSESELAAVIAHEITHVTQRHLFRAWQAASSTTLAQAAILLAAIALGAAAGGDAAIAAASAGQAAIQQGQINFTRANEKEPDRLGIRILADAGYEPRAMPTFFSRMGKANQYYATTLPEFLRTHPVTTSRISDSLGRAEKFPHRQHADDLRYHLTRAAIKQQSFENPESAIDYFSKTLEDGRYRSREADQYGYALALLRDRQLDKARQAITPLRQGNPEVLEFIVTAARIEAEDGKLDRATMVLEKALPNFPRNRPLILELATLQLRNKQPRKAYKMLSELDFRRPGDALVYELLAQAAADMGDQIKSHEYVGLHYYTNGALKAARTQFQIALRDEAIAPYDAARIESRLAAVKAEIHALELDKKH